MSGWDRAAGAVARSGVAHSGRIAVKHEDGTELEIGAGEAYVIEPGHDAWSLGDEGFVGFEFEERSAEEFAKGWTCLREPAPCPVPTTLGPSA